MNAPNSSGWKPEMGSGAGGESIATASGDRGLMLEEPLIFELGQSGTSGVDFEEMAGEVMPELERGLLVTATECTTDAEIEVFAAALAEVLA